MSTSPRRPAFGPLINRQYEPSRLQCDSLMSAYSLVIPAVSRRLGQLARRPGEHDGVRMRSGELRPSASGGRP
jgi:hypothetical protein